MEYSQNLVDKLSHLLTQHYSMFQADMLERVILDENIDIDMFEKGLEDLENYRMNTDEDDEYMPVVFTEHKADKSNLLLCLEHKDQFKRDAISSIIEYIKDYLGNRIENEKLVFCDSFGRPQALVLSDGLEAVSIFSDDDGIITLETNDGSVSLNTLNINELTAILYDLNYDNFSVTGK